MGDFVTPELVRLPLTGGQTIDIIKRLTHGETEDMYARIRAAGAVRTVKILAYLVGWSLTRNSSPVPYAPGLPTTERLDTIRALDPDLAVEIYDAIEAHEQAQDQARAEAKKKAAGTPPSAAISQSPSAVDGPSETSAP